MKGYFPLRFFEIFDNTTMEQHILKYNQPFHLEKGGQLPYLEITYSTAGTYNPLKNNVVWVCHALTANSDVFDWWEGLFGEADLFNTKEHFIVCANVLGSCYGTSGPLQAADANKFHQFPEITIRDMVKAHQVLQQHLGIQKVNTIIGGSLGGQQALEWTIQQPDLFDNLIALATNAAHSPWGIAFNESQRMAIEVDSTWVENKETAGIEGMKTARSIALLSYRTYQTYNLSQGETDVNKTADYKAISYQRYQGEKLARRFNAFAYYRLSQAMDSHNIGRNRKSIENALAQIKTKTLIIGISSDGLFPVNEQQFLAQHIPNAYYTEIDSYYGHDGFLVETEKLTAVIQEFYQKIEKKNPLFSVVK